MYWLKDYSAQSHDGFTKCNRKIALANIMMFAMENHNMKELKTIAVVENQLKITKKKQFSWEMKCICPEKLRNFEKMASKV